MVTLKNLNAKHFGLNLNANDIAIICLGMDIMLIFDVIIEAENNCEPCINRGNPLLYHILESLIVPTGVIPYCTNRGNPKT